MARVLTVVCRCAVVVLTVEAAATRRSGIKVHQNSKTGAVTLENDSGGEAVVSIPSNVPMSGSKEADTSLADLAVNLTRQKLAQESGIDENLIRVNSVLKQKTTQYEHFYTDSIYITFVIVNGCMSEQVFVLLMRVLRMVKWIWLPCAPRCPISPTSLMVYKTQQKQKQLL